MSLDERDERAETDERGGDAGDGEDAALTREELAVRVELLEEEAERLREEYARLRRTRHRRTALGLLGVGLVAIGGGLLFPATRTALFALGATGLFAAVLTHYLTPGRFVSAGVSDRVFVALADNEAAVADDLGLSKERVYVPTERAGERTVRLFVPQFSEFALPEDLEPPLVVTEDERERGLSLRPTGDALFAEFERALTGPPADEPGELAAQLADGVVEQFELATGATTDVGADGAVVVVGITGSTYGRVDRFDHPVASLLGVGLARGLDVPVSVSVEPGERADYLVEARPLRDAEGSDGPEGAASVDDEPAGSAGYESG